MNKIALAVSVAALAAVSSSASAWWTGAPYGDPAFQQEMRQQAARHADRKSVV